MLRFLIHQMRFLSSRFNESLCNPVYWINNAQTTGLWPTCHPTTMAFTNNIPVTYIVRKFCLWKKTTRLLIYNCDNFQYYNQIFCVGISTYTEIYVGTITRHLFSQVNEYYFTLMKLFNNIQRNKFN